MALQLPKIDLSNAKTRVFIIFGGVIAFVALIYIGVHFFSKQSATTGVSHVAGTPAGLQSVPGGQLTPEYYRALVQANTQAAKQAQISGGSAVPTLLNEPGAQPAFQQPAAPSCTVVCPTAENVNVDNDINDLVKAGKLAPEDGKRLMELAHQNVAVSEYSAALDQLVKQGKLTPEQARKLLDDYKQQHENNLLKESGQAMDALIKSGQLPLDVANQLLDLQKKHVSPAEYTAALNRLVREGKITPQTAAQLLAQYTQQHAKEAAAEAIGQLEQMAAAGKIPPDVAKELEGYQKRNATVSEYEEELQHLVKQGKLTPEQAQQLLEQYRQRLSPEVATELADYQKRNVPLEEYQAELQRLVTAGKLTPEQAQQLLEQYRQFKSAAVPTGGTLEKIVRDAEQSNEDAVKQLASSGKISPDAAQKLLDLQRQHVSADEYKRQLDEMVREGKISAGDAQKLLNNYQQLEQQRKGEGIVQDLLTSGKISPDTAQKLLALQRSNVPLDAYKQQLDELVREGKISSGDAQRLLENYMEKRGAGVQDLLESGKISPETAQKLLDLQRQHVSADEYKRQLDQMVRDGKMSAADAQKLFNNYQQMQQQRGDVQDLLANGKISPETAQRLLALQRANVPIDEYKRQLDEMVRQGKISSADAQKLLTNYMEQRGAGVQDLLAGGKISPETAQKLLDLQGRHVSADEYKRQLDDLVRQGKISPADAQRLYENYQKLQNLRQEADKLNAMRLNNASVPEYANELKKAVAAGIFTPEQAARLLQEYQTAKTAAAAAAAPGAPLPPLPNVPGAAEFARMQQRVQAKEAAAAAAPPPGAAAVTTEQFNAAAAKAREEAEKEEQDRLQAIMSRMSSQAQQLISTWQPPAMEGRTGATEKEQPAKGAPPGSASAAGSSSQSSTSTAAPIIKAGTIFYAVLDTAANSDFPDTPIMATIVSGPFKGAKLLGKLAITQGQDRVSLTFNLMNMEDWPKGKSITAFAIDPDTARTALASNVNYHYFVRYGSMMASSFVQGYASAISQSGSTTSSGIFGTTTTHPSLNVANKVATGIGQVGTAFGNAISGYINTPPTVKIDPGVSLGILFMGDVSG